MKHNLLNNKINHSQLLTCLMAVLLTLFCLTTISPAYAFHFPWDQGHDTTEPNNPNDPGPCEGPNCDPCKSTGSPVYVPTGHFIWSETDISMAGRPGLSISRTYNSHDPKSGGFGNGWSSDCDLKLLQTVKHDQDENGNSIQRRQLALVAANGKRFTYQQNAEGAYLAPQGRTDTVTDLGNGSLRLTSQGGYAHQFDSTGRLTQRTEPNGNSINYLYDAAGRISSLSDNAGRSISFAYTTNGFISSVTDHTGRAWHYEYDDNGNLITVTDPLQGVQRYEYQPYTATGDGQTYYQLTRIVDASDVVVSTITYSDDRVASYTVGENRYSYRYDLSNRRVTKTDLLSSRWIFEYNEEQVITRKTDPLGNVKQYQYDEDGNLIAYTDALGEVWLSTFDDTKRKLSHTTPLGFKTDFEYGTSFPHPTKVTGPTGREQLTQLDSRGNAISSTNGEGASISMLWDTNGNLTRLTDALGNASAMTYNSYGLVASTTDALNHTAQFTYDSLGRVTVLASAEGQQITTEYDELDRVTRIIDPSGNITAYTYDEAGRTLSHTDPAGRVTRYEYDSFGRMTKRTYPDDREIIVRYRRDNLVDRVTRPDNTLAQYSYNASKLVTQANLGGSTTRYTYSPRYELLSVSNNTGSVAYTYDNDGRVVSETQGGQTLTYTYNAENERTGYSLLGQTYSYTRDQVGRVTGITAPEGNYAFTYDDNGKRISHSLPNGSQTNYTYDVAERLTDLRHQGAYQANYNYQYRDDNTLAAITADTGNWTYSYDADRQLIAADNDGTDYSYATDAAGNITSNSRTYDENHRLIASATHSFTYDERGNLSRKTDTQTQAYTQYTWNGEDQLVRVDRFADDQATAPSTTISFTYGPLGRRWTKTVNGSTETYVYNGENLVATLNSDGSTKQLTTFSTAIDEPLSADFSGSRRYFHGDHLGSIVALSDDSVTTDTYGYGPFGENLGATGTTDNPFRYTGREQDADDLYYYRNRYYDPTLQRFISEDRYGLAGGDHNLYRYVGNNPANFTDPSGNWAFLIPVIWGGIELGLAAYDAYNTYQTLSDPCIGNWEKAAELGLLAAGALLPGGGYTKADDAARYADDIADAVRRNPCGCFDGETEVLTEDGYKAIKDVEQYEKVLAKDEVTGETAYKAVTELLRYENRDFYQLELVAEDGTISQYTVTDDHPFWVKDIGWVESDELRQGMPVMDLQNEVHTVHYLVSTGERGKAYNFEVDDFHTYFVGREGIWVHNCPNAEDARRVAEQRRRRAERRERKSRERNGQNQSGEGYRDHENANKGPSGERPKGPDRGNNRERNIGIDEEHSRVPKGSGSTGGRR